MDNFFPADVSLRVEGDEAAAQALFPAARNLLFRALRVQANGDKANVNLFLNLPNGSLVSVVLARGLKHVYVNPGPRPGSPPTREPDIEAEYSVLPDPSIYFMLSGMVRSIAGLRATVGDTVIDGAFVKVLNSFSPSGPCSGAYDLPVGLQFSTKLAVNQSGVKADGTGNSAWPKASMYSGAMKRVVQALVGIGVQETDTAEYFTEAVPVSLERVAWNPYDFTWLRTHGIYKNGNGFYWLIEISKDEGVMAMPLTVFLGTGDDSYAAWLTSTGDLDTLAVVQEFGGLPMGETFPTGAALTTAITNGKVLRLLTAADVLPFYRDTVNAVDKSPLFAACGWAFSESGKAAINTAMWYQNGTIAAHGYDWFVTNGDISYTYAQRYKTADYWRIDLALSDVNTGTVTAVNPIGTGTAALSLVESRQIHHAYDERVQVLGQSDFRLWTSPLLMVPKETDAETCEKIMYFGNSLGATSGLFDGVINNAAVYVFFNGEEVEAIRHDRRSSYPGVGHGQISSGSDLGAGWYGTTVNFNELGLVYGGGIIIPNYCREGYIAVRPISLPGVTVTDSNQIMQRGFFPSLGVVVLPNIALTVATYVLRLADYYLGVHFCECAYSVNAGASGGFHSTQGCHFNVSYGDAIPPLVYVVSPEVAQLGIPAGMAVDHVSFVGSP